MLCAKGFTPLTPGGIWGGLAVACKLVPLCEPVQHRQCVQIVDLSARDPQRIDRAARKPSRQPWLSRRQTSSAGGCIIKLPFVLRWTVVLVVPGQVVAGVTFLIPLVCNGFHV